MNIRKLRIHRFPCQEGFDQELPRNGIILITGSNGVGKSGLLEAISWAVWGKTLRGTTLPQAHVSVEAAEAVVERKGSTLRWHVPGEAPVQYPTKSKATEALQTRVGSHTLWRRSSVFRRGGTSFAAATDAKRKELLEQLAGVGGFDAGLKLCRVDLKRAQLVYGEHHRNLASQQQSLDYETRRRDEAEVARASVCGRAVEDIERELGAVQAELDAAQQAADEAGQGRSNAAVEHGQRAAHYDTAQQNLRATEQGRCGTCGQAISEDIAAQLRMAAQAATTARDRTDEEYVQKAAAVVAANSRLREVQDRLNVLRIELGQARVRESVAAGQESVIAEAEALIERLRVDIQHVESELVAATGEVQLREACSDVLGLRGARVRVLGRCLAAVEASANWWLPRLAPPAMLLKLSSQSVRKSGAIVDAISLAVSGIGEHASYHAASGGQQRRIDVACMLALGELAAEQRPAGTLWFDEVFDTLDPAGVEAVAEILQELARDRAVAVITHNPRLVEGLPRPELHLKL